MVTVCKEQGPPDYLLNGKGVYTRGVNISLHALLTLEAGSLKKNTALEYSTRVVQKGGPRCKKSTLNDFVHLTPLRIPLMNPPLVCGGQEGGQGPLHGPK